MRSLQRYHKGRRPCDQQDLPSRQHYSFIIKVRNLPCAWLPNMASMIRDIIRCVLIIIDSTNFNSACHPKALDGESLKIL